MRANLLWINFRFAECAKCLVEDIKWELYSMIVFAHTPPAAAATAQRDN
ncbi:hypothetical protein E2C01_095173 [Portunus trituberculatus]|uniref:Uncharacterized protein n=1 Tax=Portunus trituberculatus TaxID=210409 RepID=A0A5B7JP55_PORTR|nr:hypothetical protein [Portunus trituberculatus]